jgi:transposase
VVLPNKAAHFRKTLTVRTVTDQSDCRMLTQLGLEKQLDFWSPPHPLFAQLKQLTRERKRLKDEVTRLKNQRHATGVAIQTLPATQERINQRLALCEQHISAIENQIRQLVNNNKEVKQRFRYVCSIQGVGLITAVTVVSEADGFNLVRNVRQLVCYAGYDVVEKQSGSSVKGKPRISKQGNSYIRRALYFPAITAVRKSQPYQRSIIGYTIVMHSYESLYRATTEIVSINLYDVDKTRILQAKLS